MLSKVTLVNTPSQNAKCTCISLSNLMLEKLLSRLIYVESNFKSMHIQ